LARSLLLFRLVTFYKLTYENMLSTTFINLNHIFLTILFFKQQFIYCEMDTRQCFDTKQSINPILAFLLCILLPGDNHIILEEAKYLGNTLLKSC